MSEEERTAYMAGDSRLAEVLGELEDAQELIQELEDRPTQEELDEARVRIGDLEAAIDDILEIVNRVLKGTQ